MKLKELFQDHFMRKWVSLNLLGWFLGLALGPLLFLIILPYSRNIPFPIILIGDLQTLCSSFLFGLGLGSMQQILLRRWDVPSNLWILATAFGIAIPTTLISWLLDSDLLGNGLWIIFVLIAEILLMGFGIGGLQAILIRKRISKVSSWVWAYVIGFFIIGFAAIVIIVIAYLLAEPIEKFFYSLRLWQLVEYRDAILLVATGLVLPFLAAYCISLPTGKILQKSDGVQTTIEDENEEPPKAKIALS